MNLMMSMMIHMKQLMDTNTICFGFNNVCCDLAIHY